MVKTISSLKEEIILLLEAERYDVVRSWFMCWKDEEEMIDKILVFGHVFFPHYFKDESPEFHRDLIKRFFSKKNEYTACPRGFAKTTIIQICSMFAIINKLDKFIVIIEKSFHEASEVIEGIRKEFMENELLKFIFGDMMPKVEDKDPNAKGDVVINKVRLRAKGFETTIRGLKHRADRPSRIICDDLEKDEHINNPDQRQKYEKNYNAGIVPAVDIHGVVKVFGTILHLDSLLMNLINSHHGKVYKAFDPEDPMNTLLWASRWSYEKLMEKKADMQMAGKSSNEFAREYLNDPISEEERIFKRDWLYKEYDLTNGLKYKVPTNYITIAEFNRLRQSTVLNGFAQIDIADTTGEKSDYTGVIVEFVNPAGTRFVVVAERRRIGVNGLVDLVYEVWEKWRPYGLMTIGIEKKGFEDQVKPLLDEEKNSGRRKSYPLVTELKPMGRNKENRISGALQGLFESGKIVFVVEEKFNNPAPTSGMISLLEELYNFPSSKNDDLSDALAYSADIIIIPQEEDNKKRVNKEPNDDPYKEEMVFSDSDSYDDPY